MRPLIGVTTSEMRPSSLATTRRHGEPAHPEMALGMTYLRTLDAAGAIPVVLPPVGTDHLSPLLDRLDGICLSGGPDLDPAAYGATDRHAQLGPTEPSLDAFELSLAREALTRNIPILAICRGSQALNVACGGTLHQHVDGHRQTATATEPTHEVEVEAGSRLHRITRSRRLAVNSFHHQAVDKRRRRPEGRRPRRRRHGRGHRGPGRSRSACSGTRRRCTPTWRCSRRWLGRLPVPNCGSPHDTLGRVPALRLRGVVKRFGNLTAVDHLDLEVPEGTCVGLLGPNGAGKSTTMRLLTAQAIPDEGEIEILGLPVPARSKEARAMCGVVPQLDNLDVTLTVEENLRVFAYLYRVPRAERKAAVERALGIANLTDRRDTKVDHLSGGMRRRLLIARGLVHQPRLILLDEPTVGLDPQVRQELWALVDRLRSEGVSILMSTHYIEEAERLADTVTIMSHGKAVATGTPRDLIAEHAGPEAVEVYGPPAKLQEVERDAQGQGPQHPPDRHEHLDPARQRRQPRGRAPPDEPRGRLRPADGRGDRVSCQRLGRLERPALAGRARPRDHQLRELLALLHVQRHRRADGLPARVRLRVRLARVHASAATTTSSTSARARSPPRCCSRSAFPAMFGTFVKYKFQRTYDAILAAPVDTEELVTAEALWIACAPAPTAARRCSWRCCSGWTRAGGCCSSRRSP